MILNTKIIYEAVYKMAEKANTVLPFCVYEKLRNFKGIKPEILQNVYLAKTKKRPLCQDCGQVIVFLQIGQGVRLEGDYIEDAVNKAVKDCYIENFYRKSVVKDALSRENTGTNTPCIIHTEIIKGKAVKILLALKGGGAENASTVKMFNPTASKEDIYDFVKETIRNAGENACPPVSVGVGAGGTIESACLLAKKALYFGKNLPLKIKNAFEIKLLTCQTHIASMPVCVNINCHSARYCSCEIKDSKIFFQDKDYMPFEINISDNSPVIYTSEIKKIKKLKPKDKIKLTGIIYTARDMAHLRLVEMIKNGEKLPFNLENSIIFYAGPCPKKEGEIIGPVGPTTAKRMDKFAPVLYEKGVLATIGKGKRTINKGLYFKMTGGVASFMQDCIKKSELVAFEDLKAEAIYRLEVENLPLEVGTV